jgi:hypothetical protein
MSQDNYVKVKRFGILSVARMAAIFGVAIGVLAIIFSVVTGALGVVPGFSAANGLGVGLVVLVVFILGMFLGGAVEAFLYNAIVKIVGPVQILLQKDAIDAVNPLSYAKVSLVFGVVIYGLLALFVSSVLLATIGVSSSATTIPLPLLGAAFVFAVVLYGFVLPYVWALIYNWLARKLGGIGIVIDKDVVKHVDVWSYVKIMVVLTFIVFVLERIIGTLAGVALRMPLASSGLAAVAGTIVVIVAGLVTSFLVAGFYNFVAKHFGGIDVHIKR